MDTQDRRFKKGFTSIRFNSTSGHTYEAFVNVDWLRDSINKHDEYYSKGGSDLPRQILSTEKQLTILEGLPDYRKGYQYAVQEVIDARNRLIDLSNKLAVETGSRRISG